MRVRVDFELVRLTALQRMMFYGVGYGYRTPEVLLRLYAPFDRNQLERDLFGLVRANLLELSPARAELSYSKATAALMQAALEKRALEWAPPSEGHPVPPFCLEEPSQVEAFLERHLEIPEAGDVARKLHLWLHPHED